MTVEIEQVERAPETLVIGVLALQGAFHEHIAYLNRYVAPARAARRRRRKRRR